jgi:hypothetical protein
MRHWLTGAFATCAACAFAAVTATAQDTVKMGFVLPMTGPVASVGKQVSAGAQLYIQQHGNLKQFPAYLNRWDPQQARNEGVFAH